MSRTCWGRCPCRRSVIKPLTRTPVERTSIVADKSEPSRSLPRLKTRPGVMGYAHVLVDEAQDTNESQWAIVKALTEAVLPLFDRVVERHGLLLIVALGESVVAVGIGLGNVRLDLGLVAAAVLGLALAAGLWWTYFTGDEQGAERALSSASGDRRFRLANNAYFYAYIPMLLGVIVIAAGVKLSIGHVAERLGSGPALALAGGVAIYLTGDVAFRRTRGIRPVGYRVAAAAGYSQAAYSGLRAFMSSYSSTIRSRYQALAVWVRTRPATTVSRSSLTSP